MRYLYRSRFGSLGLISDRSKIRSDKYTLLERARGTHTHTHTHILSHSFSKSNLTEPAERRCRYRGEKGRGDESRKKRGKKRRGEGGGKIARRRREGEKKDQIAANFVH